ncbi:hypothetical protein ABEB36_007375 [Hypothenemus hampei]|uniref:Transmembrane protein 209 n=1 Tax=Hypothenemus hampei TaxID=57062 RepID=A0ABD1ETU2_HYPHA
MSSHSPNRSINRSDINQSLYNNSGALSRSIFLNKRRFELKDSFLWLGVNSVLLAIVFYDLAQTCPMYMSYYHYIEYSLLIIFTLNVLYYFARILRLYISKNQIALSAQKTQVKECDTSSLVVNYPHCCAKLTSSPLSQKSSLNVSWKSNLSSSQQPATPFNLSARSWLSNPSQNNSMHVNFSGLSGNWNDSFMLRNYRDDEEDLFDDIKEEESLNELNTDTQNSNNLLSSFWSYPTTKTKDISTFLAKDQYQLSVQSTTKTSPTSNLEDKTGSNTAALEAWTRISVDTVALTQWNENLRMWISKTILERLVKEFKLINESLEKHGMSEIKIGSVGLDRLRKIAATSQITHFIPSLVAIIPFLELHANQGYLVKRIQELANGGCMSEFKWNRGGTNNGKEWDDSLPTDCSIVMHLLASYLDTQLMPSPNMPDSKAFSGRYYLKASEKMPALSSNSLFIQEVTEKPPHYRVIGGEKIYEMVKGYNNLFHSILFFIHHVNKVEQGMLGRVNLGRAGVNILWIIEINE